ncbi:MAG TPA: SDR family NAD(P)-dependent oxidoreductase [Xanthobacteraceae bacterium]|jgi:NAD(P)-dependent dehydrogenase (short-subunit alcohol dehydrogenase family)|nr:SDR family NAD(P)-dependent oxidoreductase [Xanthobacteraceae bacterium]
MNFHGRHIVVTGGAGALGTAVVAALIEAGAACRVPCFDDAEAKRFRLREHKQVEVIVAGNLAEPAVASRVFEGLPSLWASIHIAGGFAFAALRDAEVATIRQQVDMNFLSCILCCRAAVQAMTANAPGAGGRIVNIAARPALEWRSGANMAAYAASKAAVAALTVALSEEVAKDGILVNAVAPSTMDTPANRQAMPKADFALWPKVEEVAATILFLASPDNRVTRGAIVPVYGKS